MREQHATRTDEQASIDHLQRDVLEAVALGRPLAAVMDLLCRGVETLAPEVICSVLSVDEEGRVHPLAAPSLPTSFSGALEGFSIGPRAGSCGTAAWRRQPVEVTDIASDPLWADFRELALPHGLAACWSTPILLGNGPGRRHLRPVLPRTARRRALPSPHGAGLRPAVPDRLHA